VPITVLNVLKEESPHQLVHVQMDNISMVINVLIVLLNVLPVLIMKSVLLVLMKQELKLQFVNVKSDTTKTEPLNVHHVLINVKSVTLIQTIVSLVLVIESLHQNVTSQNKLVNQLLLKD
jgi:hypothetical protein